MDQKGGTSRKRKLEKTDKEKPLEDGGSAVLNKPRELDEPVVRKKTAVKESKGHMCLVLVLIFSVIVIAVISGKVGSNGVEYLSFILILLCFSVLDLGFWYYPYERQLAVPTPPSEPLPRAPPPLPPSSRISTLVIGKSGTGKSTLIYGLLGVNKDEIERKTKAMSSPGITTDEVDVQGVKVEVNVWVSPEKDKREPDDKIVEKIQEVDFVLLTLRMDDTRSRPGDKTILRNLGHVFGTDIWKKTVVALTYANRVDYFEAGQPKKSKSHLEQRKAEWISAVHKVLEEEEIPRNLMCSIPMLPAGYFKTPELFGESWRDALVTGIVSRVNSKAKKYVKRVLNIKEEATIPKSYCFDEK